MLLVGLLSRQKQFTGLSTKRIVNHSVNCFKTSNATDTLINH